MSTDILRGYATNGAGDLIVHLWEYDRPFGFYVSLCGNKTSRGVSSASEDAKECKSCCRSKKAKLKKD